MKRILGILIPLLCAAPAQAATVEVVERPDPEQAGTVYVEVHLRAAAGETNRLSLSRDGATMTVRDLGAAPTAGRNCTRQLDGSLTCDIRDAIAVKVDLGDGDDELRLASGFTPPLEAGDTLPVKFRATEVTGGGGNDLLIGDDGVNTLHGGGGVDVLQGGGASDYLHDSDGKAGAADGDVLDGGDGEDLLHYDDRASGVTVDLGAGTAPDGDRLRSIEGVYGTPHADGLRGTGGEDSLYGGGGNDRLEGLAGADHLGGGHGDDVLLAGDGADHVQADLGRDTVDGGEGDDELEMGLQLDEVVDRVACGTGRDTIVKASFADRYGIDCELLEDYSGGFPYPAGAQLSARPRTLRPGTVGFRAACPTGRGCTVRLELYEWRKGRRHGPAIGRSTKRHLPGTEGRVLAVALRRDAIARNRGRNLRVEAVLVGYRGSVEFPVRIRL